MKVKGTTRNDFDPQIVLQLLKNEEPIEYTRILEEACHVIEGLRRDLGHLKDSIALLDISVGQWELPDKTYEEDLDCVEVRLPPGTPVLVNYNDETGEPLYSVEAADDVGNWLESFDSFDDAFEYIQEHEYEYNHVTDFRDTRHSY